MVTLAGIPLFYPFYKKSVYFLLIQKWEFEVEILDKKELFFYVLFPYFLYAGFICKWFWSTVNNNFNVKHQIKEYQNLQML
jgi:hypothetical protein